MAILKCHCLTKPQILSSSDLPNDSSPSVSPRPRPRLKPTQPPPANSRKLERKLRQKPSILEIERAIGAGIFRDRNINSEAEENTSLFDNMMRNSVGKNEGSVEKKLRQTGEWLIVQTERTSRAAGKQMLLTMFAWIIPAWIFGFVVASGIVQLPFHIPFLEDLLS